MALLEFPCVGKEKSWKLTRAKLQQLQEAFPDLDALAECRKAKGWVEANPQRRKTARGMMRFLFGWLSRTQDRGPPRQVAAGAGAPDPVTQALDALVARGRRKEASGERG